ncbi:LysM domain protein [Aspergillus piperis CBS 112811]|uniref:LysM domain protein n=1 Tax=Aspergillus piperis CBS 112811 TaxID=1448313 RepID=A0A8G1R0B3_9EURO|nr:LysM domain protein [Aspergillus piperis CBS 112811]RAH57731.1 LysM domain protein [Aspergillus piperis CBS 112811]
MFTNYTGLSTSCKGALATNVTCSPYLGIISESNGIMTTDQVNAVCIDSCYASLKAARSTIMTACTLSTDVITIHNIAYPPTFISDDCNSVALDFSVSTYSLLYMNNLDLYCQNWADTVINSTICIPPTCDTYVWQMQDTCDNVVSRLANVTVPQFLAWNPNFNTLCQNGVNYIGYVVCIGPPGGYLNHTTGTVNTTTSNPSGITTVAPMPPNALNGSNVYCGKWYTVVEGDTCSAVSVANSISLTDFYFLNPEIDANCTNLELGQAYCITAVGNIKTYSGYPTTTPWITVPTASFSAVDTSIPIITSDPGFIYTPRYLPAAPGTISNCQSYVNYDNTTSNLNSCIFIAYAYDVTTHNLLSWNPSLDTNLTTCALQPGYSYCALLNSTYLINGDYTDNERHSLCLPINATESTTVANCNCFTQIYGYLVGDYQCEDIESDFNITATELKTWNPWLSGNCDTALYANITGNDLRAVCVGVGSSSSITTTATTATTTSTKTTESAAPTQTGVITGCQEFFIVKYGDDCSTMEAEFGVTLEELYEWNPSIGPTCTNLWLGYAYCVKGPVPTTIAPVSISPTKTGSVSNCNKYHTVLDHDSCAAIESEYDITFAQLYDWNPEIGSDCRTLVIGDAVCVGISS